MKLYYKILPGLLAMLLSVASCSKDAEPAGQSEDVTLFISTGTTLTKAPIDPSLPGADPDYRIGTLRVLIYNATTGRLAFKTEKFTPPNNPQKIDMKTGRYDFVFIANEYRDPALSGYLENTLALGTNLNGISSLSIASSAFTSTIQGGALIASGGEKSPDKDTFIPMVKIERDVTVHNIEGKSRVKLSGETAYEPSPWNVELGHAGVRIDLTLNLTDEQLGAELSLSNIPDHVDLLGKYNYDTGRIEATSRKLNAGVAGTKSGGMTPVVWSRIILPETYFYDKTAPANGILLTAKVGSETYTARLGYEILASPKNYTIRRGSYLKITGTILQEEEIQIGSITVAPWGPQNNVNIDNPIN